MSKVLDRLSRLVTARPWITILVLAVITVLLAAGGGRRVPPTEGADVAFLPPGHPIANATHEIDESFGDSGEVNVVTLLFRGDALTPGGLSQMSSLIDEIVSDPRVGELLAPANPIIAPSSLISAVLQVDDFQSITQAQIDAARNIPEIQGALAAMTGTDADNAPVAIANIRLNDTGDERIQNAERKISELAAGDEGPLRVSSLSPVIVEDEYTEATQSGMVPLIGLALLLIVALLLLFTRALSDTLLTLTGLIFSIIMGCRSGGLARAKWAGPDRPSEFGLLLMVPVIIISLTVDYAIQTVSHYREQRVAGEPVLQAVRSGTAQRHDPADPGCRHDYRQPAGDPVLADWRYR